MTVAERLIERDIATPDVVGAAIHRQQLYGGDLITNLLELTAADEANLLKVLALEYQVPQATAGPLPYSSKAALEVVPEEVATTFSVFPLRVDDNQLVLAASQPLSTSTELELGVSLKLTPTVILALAPRVKQAIARDYAFTLDKRTQRAIDQLDSRSVRYSSRAPGPLGQGPSLAELPRPPSIAPLGFPEAWSDTPSGGSLNAETVKAPPVAKIVDSRDSNLARVPSTTKQRDPLSSTKLRDIGNPKERAESNLANATTSEETMQALLDFSALFFDRCAVFTLHNSRAELRHSRGWAETPERRPFPLSMHPKLRELANLGQWYIGPLKRDDPALDALLGDGQNHNSYLGTVRIRDRTLLILLGAKNAESVRVEDLGELLAFQTLAAQALERLVLQRKRK